MFSYGEGNKAAAVDISGMKYLEFDVFVSDPAIIADVEFSFELTSGGTADQQENAKKFKGKDTGWVQGWNHVKWALTEFDAKTGGELDFTKWNYIRWYNDSALNATNWLQVAIKDIQFTTGVAAPEAPSCIEVPIDSDKWDQCVLKENWEGKDKVQYRGFAAGSSHGAGGFMFRYGEGNTVPATDITGMKYLEFDVYVTNVADLANVEFSFELTSCGGSDAEESAKKFKGQDTGWVNGWNHVKWELTEFNVKNGEFDPTKWNFIRWYNDTTLTVGSEKLMVAIVNIKFTNGVAAPEAPETPEVPETPATNTVDMPSFSLGDGKDTAYAERTNSQGWKTVGCAILTGKEYAGADTWAITLNGKNSAPGKLTSATLNGGIKSLSFKYGFPFGDDQFKITINIKKGDEVVATTTLEKTGLTKETVYEFTWTLDTPVDGEFTIEIVNECLSDSSKNKDRLSIWDITWENK
jgi:hypothetical protein